MAVLDDLSHGKFSLSSPKLGSDSNFNGRHFYNLNLTPVTIEWSITGKFSRLIFSFFLVSSKNYALGTP